MPSYKKIKSIVQVSKGKELPKGTVLLPDWLAWMFHYMDLWTLVGILLFNRGICFKRNCVVHRWESETLK